MIDLDNTLGNRTAAVHAWIAEFVRDHDLPPGAAELILRADNDGYSSRFDVFTAIRDRFELRPTVEALLEAYQDRVVALAAPTPGAIDCLKQLRSAGWSIAIVTNGSTRQQHGKIDAIGFRELVDAVIVSGDLQIKKPDRRIFEAAASAAGVPLDNGWMVGDAPLHDIVGAQALGLRTAWIHRDRSWPDEHPPPTVVLDDLRGLFAAISEHG